MTTKGYFITGTDTGVGKTKIAVALLKTLKQKGYRTAGMKPVSSGAIKTAQGLRNEDALSLLSAATLKASYDEVNPFVFEPHIAPHIAAKINGEHLSVKTIWEACQPILNADVDYIVVEGAGGFKVPLNNRETMAEFARKINFPIILVIGLRLGCLNHASLTAQAIESYGISTLGWVGYPYVLEPEMPYLHENIESLKERLNMPFLGIYPDLLFSEIESFSRLGCVSRKSASM